MTIPERPDVATRLARAAAAGLKSWTARISSRRPRVPGPLKVLLAALFVPPFALVYGLLKVQGRLRGVIEVEAETIFGARCACRLPDLIQTYLYLFGIWEPDITSFISRRLAPGDTFVDVGANVGYHVLLASRVLDGRGRVTAIEASPAVFRALLSNLALNGDPSNVRAINMAASDVPGRVKVYRGPDHNVGLTTTVRTRGLPAEAEVEGAPLADLLERGELRTARLVKIDVEGAEDVVLRGMRSFLKACPRDVEIVLELSPLWWADQRQTVEQVLKELLDAGFHPYRISNNLFPWRYLWPNDVAPPRRMRELPRRNVKRIDMVLSREDRETL